MNTDLIVIGAGPGGYRAAEYAAKEGLHVVVVEQNEVGGTCLNRGCIPTKTYVHSPSFADAIIRQPQVVQQLRSGVEAILSHPNITLLRGHAAFTDARTVTVTAASSEPSASAAAAIAATAPSATAASAAPAATAASASHAVGVFDADNILIATGSSAKMPPISGLDDPRVVTSTELLQMTALPKRLCIIGAGVIGMEFASVFHRFGSEVMVIEYLKECLPMMDSDIAKRLRKLLEKRGITFRMKTTVQSLADIDADTILIATGRQPNTQGLNLDSAGITTDSRGFIPVDDNYRVVTNSSTAHIYAIGDVNGRQLLAHAAEMQAVRAVNTMLGKTDGIRFDIMPAAIFTEPEAACVGPSEDQLKADGSAYVCHKSFWRANGKALAMGETDGILKLFADSDDRIIGCHAYGAHAADIVQEVSALMCRNTTVAQLRDMVHIHPTLGEILVSGIR